MSTQEISNKLIPQNYLHALLQPDIVADSKLPALNVPSADLLPSGSVLSVNPPNLNQVTYQTISEANYLHSNTHKKRDLSYILQRWVYYQAANRGHVPQNDGEDS